MFVRNSGYRYLNKNVVNLCGTGPLPAENVTSQTHGATYGTILPDLVHRVQVTGSGRGELFMYK